MDLQYVIERVPWQKLIKNTITTEQTEPTPSSTVLSTSTEAYAWFSFVFLLQLDYSVIVSVWLLEKSCFSLNENEANIIYSATALSSLSHVRLKTEMAVKIISVESRDLYSI